MDQFSCHLLPVPQVNEHDLSFVENYFLSVQIIKGDGGKCTHSPARLGGIISLGFDKDFRHLPKPSEIRTQSREY